jgi:hypothetical protein
MGLLAYVQRWGGGFADNNGAKPVDAQFLNAVETALLGLLGAAPTDGQVQVYDNALSRFKTILLTNAHIDPAAAIAKSKLASLQITDADVASGAAISKSKLNLGSSLSLISTTYILNGTTSYTSPGNATKLDIEGWGGGGAGFGCVSSGTNAQLALGGGGGGAAWASKLLLTNLGVHTVAVGVGGAAAAGQGSNGGDTTFADSLGANVLTAKGGGASLDNVTAGTSITIALPGGAGSAAGSVGDKAMDGDAPLSLRLGSTIGDSVGGASPRGGQAQHNFTRVSNQGSAGITGKFPGGGGSGGIDTNILARSGGNGANGLIIVKAYA